MKSTAPKISIRGGGAKLSTKTWTVVLVGLALRAVVAHPGPAGLELGQGVAGDDPVEVGVAQRAERLGVGPHQQLGADVRPVDDGGERDRGLLGAGSRATSA